MQNIFVYFISISGVTTFAIWISKLVISKTFDIGLEKYKANLVKEIEEHKSNLSKLTYEHNVKFNKLHEDRAEKIQKLYGMVIDLEKALIYSTTIAQGSEFMSDNARDEACIEKIQELIRQLDYDKIYFSNDTVIKFEKIIRESWDITFQMKKVRRYASALNEFSISGRPIPEKYFSETELWQNANERTELEFKALKEDLANEFRQLLGI